MVRAPAAFTAPRPIDPSPPALVTAAAICGVEVPAIGAWMIGTAIPIRSSKLAIGHSPASQPDALDLRAKATTLLR